jgi:hypothetical protein
MLQWMVLALIPICLVTGCGDLEPEMQDTRTVILNMDFHVKSSSRSSSSVSASELSQYNTHLILALPSGEVLTSNYKNFYSSFAQGLMNTADKKVSLEIPLNTQMKIFTFLFKENYSMSELFSGTREVGYYGESQTFSIGTNTNNLSLGVTLQSTGSTTVDSGDSGDSGGSDGGNDIHGITVNPTSGLVTTEAGDTATFTVVLNTQPTTTVTIDLSSDDTSEGTVSPASLTFTTGNWSIAQTVTVTGVDDNIDEGNQSYTIVTAAATSSDQSYSGLNATDVSVTNTDNDITGDQPLAGSWTDVGFWDFLNTGTNAVSGGSSWIFENIDYCCTTNIVLDGIYGTEKADVQTTLLDRDKFTLGFKANPSAHTKPIIVGGRSYRWLHVAVNNTGTLDLIFNNGATKLTTSQPVNVGQWHEIVINIDIDDLNVDVYIDNNPKESLSLPAGFAWNFLTVSPGYDNKLLLQNYSNGSAFAGQIDWIFAGNGLLTMDNVNYLVNQF